MKRSIESVLIVDDDELLLRAVERQLRDKVTVLVASTPDDACRITRQAQPETVLIDLNLGTYSGIELVKRLKAEYPTMPVALMSASLAVECAAYAGADYAFDKSLRVEAMLAAIAQSPALSLPKDPVTLVEAERAHVLKTLAAHHGNISQTARTLGISRSSLQRKLKLASAS